MWRYGLALLLLCLVCPGSTGCAAKTPPRAATAPPPPAPHAVVVVAPPPPEPTAPPPPGVVVALAPPAAPVVNRKIVWGGASGALRGSVYNLPPGTRRLPDLCKLSPVATVYTDVLDIPIHEFKDGWPGVSNAHGEWFAIRYEGDFTVTAGGDHGFRIESDDGSRVYVDDRQIIDNDGLHGFRGASGSVTLTPGKHHLRVDYFQGPRWGVGLILHVTPPGAQERLFSPSI
jgi:hypothetical protein